MIYILKAFSQGHVISLSKHLSDCYEARDKGHSKSSSKYWSIYSVNATNQSDQNLFIV